MKSQRRWVADTNLLVSHLLLPDSVPGSAVRKAVETGDLLVSDATMGELAEVLSRPKFDQYVSRADRTRYIELLAPLAISVDILRGIKICRDAKDDKFLEVAVNGSADALITGDKDLLSLNPFMGIPILTPRQFLDGGI